MNFRVFVKSLLAVILLCLLSGCYNSQILNYDEYTEQEIIQVITSEKDTVNFENDENILVSIENDTIKYRNTANEIFTIYKEKVESIVISEYSGSKTTACVLGSIAASAIFLSLLFFCLPRE